MSDRTSHKGNFHALAALVVAALAVSGVACERESTPARAAARAKAQEPRPVRVVAASLEQFPRTVTVTGTLAADEEVVAGFKVPGRVSELPVDLGSTVRKGQVLARLDPTDFRLRVEQAEASLRQVRAGLGLPPDGPEEQVDPEKTAAVREARAVLEEARLSRDRLKQLWEKNYVARSEFDAARARFQVAEGRYQAALERSGIARNCWPSGARGCRWRASNSPTPCSTHRSRAPCASAGPRWANTSPPERRWSPWSGSTRSACGWRCRSGMRPPSASGRLSGCGSRGT
jgi:hypothetical protein